MMNAKTILVFAGPNGSGKSSITTSFPVVGCYVNADDIQMQLACDPMEAAKIATQTREALLEQGQSFTFETVLSTIRNLELLKRARENGYYIICVYILTVHPSINVQRVKIRHRFGGHDVPEDKIIARYHRAMALIPELCSVCSRLLIFDNSSDKSDGLPDLIAEINNGDVVITPSHLWTSSMIQDLLKGTYRPYNP